MTQDCHLINQITPKLAFTLFCRQIVRLRKYRENDVKSRVFTQIVEKAVLINKINCYFAKQVPPIYKKNKQYNKPVFYFIFDIR